MSGTLFAMDQQEALSALGDRVRRRRERLGKSIDSAAADGKVSPVTWSRVELGRKVRRLSYGAVDRVLDWPEGACVDFLDSGKEPPELTAAPAEPPARDMVAELRRRIAELNDLMDEELGDRNRGTREALINGLDALVEESTTKPSGL